MAKKLTKAQRELEADWDKLQQKWGSVPKFARTSVKPIQRIPAVVKNDKPVIPSKVTPGGVGALSASKVYTGDKVLGIAVMHKSCLQPIFNEEAAHESASMRR
jgi:hypothetical protein